MKKIIKFIALGVVVSGLAVFTGCGITGKPRPRVGSYPGSAFPSKFQDNDSLGRHSYGFGLSENNGLVYTLAGGHIDIAHLRIAADNTKYFYDKTRQHLLNNETEFTFKLNVESSKYYVTLKYPDYWEKLPDKYREKIADKLALDMSQYFTYTMTTWHEVLTWFGFKCLFFLPEEDSAFSWEDIYSNLLGTKVGAMAIEDKEHNYNKAMTIALKRKLGELEAQPHQTARRAAKIIKKGWKVGDIVVDKKKNTDTGLYDGLVTPTLAPGIGGNTRPESLQVPTLDNLFQYSFGIELEIEPREFERGKILSIIYPNGGEKRIRPMEQMPIVMSYVENDAIKKGYAIIPSEKQPLVVSGG